VSILYPLGLQLLSGGDATFTRSRALLMFHASGVAKHWKPEDITVQVTNTKTGANVTIAYNDKTLGKPVFSYDFAPSMYCEYIFDWFAHDNELYPQAIEW